MGVLRGGPGPMLGTALGLASMLAVQAALTAAVSRATRAALTRRLVDRLLASDVLRAKATEPDEGLSSIFQSVYEAQQVVAEHLPGLVADAVSALALAVAGCFALRDAPALSVLVVVAAVFLGATVLSLSFRSTNRAAMVAERAFGAVYDDVATAEGGRLELVASGRTDEHCATLTEHLARWRKQAARTDALMAVAGRAPILATALVLVAGLWWSGILGASVADLGFKSAVLAASALPAFVGVVRNFVVLGRDSARIRPLVALLVAPDGPRGGPRGTALPPLPASVEWSDVSFSYAAEGNQAARLALDGVSVAWPPGQVLVLAGPNGSGKSTLLRLLLGLGQPRRGRICVGGADVFSLDLQAWRRLVAYLPQRPYLGEEYTTIRESVGVVAGSVSEAAMQRALERVSLWEELQRSSPSDPLAARVSALSVGQRQRLAVARVLCRDAPVVILDEPDANLDRDGIALVAGLVRDLRKSAMVAIAAHSPELLEVGDVRVALDDGRVIKGK
jgi:ABC-type multidrug transport system fused ATPase/permease subunit